MRKIEMSQIAIGNYHYGLYSFDYFLESVKKMGINHIELWGAKPHFCVDDQDRQSVLKFREKVEEEGLDFVCFCPEQNTYPINISCKESSIRKRSLEYLKKSIEICSWLDVDRILLCPGNGYIDEPENEIWERCRTSLIELSDVANNYGVDLLLETQSQHESRFMNSAMHQKQMIEEVDHCNLKVMLDTVQLARFDEDVKTDIGILGLENIKHVHLGNSTLQEKTWYDKKLPLSINKGKKTNGHIGFREGNLPLELYINQLSDAGYKGYLTIEICQNPYFFEAHRYGVEAYNYVKDVLDSL